MDAGLDMRTTGTKSDNSILSILRLIVQGIVSIAKSHWVTLVNFWRPTVCERYPHKDKSLDYKPGPGYKGDFALITDKEKGRLRCIACQSCERACPNHCIRVVPAGKGKDRYPAEFYIDVGLCMNCEICVEVCPVDALTMTPDYECSVHDPRDLIRNIKQLTERGMEFDEVSRVR